MVRIWNFILACISGLLLLGIFYNEIFYNRLSRFNYNLYINPKNDVHVKILKSTFLIKEDTIDLNEVEHYNRNFKKQFPPEKIDLLWFSYNDNKFYEFKGDLPYDALTDNLKNDRIVHFELDKDNNFKLFVNDKMLQNFKAKEVSIPWFDKSREREIAVFFTNDKRYFSPKLFLKSDSELSEAAFGNSERAYNDSSESDSLMENTFLYYGKPLRMNSVNNVQLELKNEKFVSTLHGGVNYFNLKVNIELDSKQLFQILKNNPSKNFDLNIYLDEKDSVKSVKLSDLKQNFEMKVKTTYGD